MVSSKFYNPKTLREGTIELTQKLLNEGPIMRKRNPGPAPTGLLDSPPGRKKRKERDEEKSNNPTLKGGEPNKISWVDNSISFKGGVNIFHVFAGLSF